QDRPRQCQQLHSRCPVPTFSNFFHPTASETYAEYPTYPHFRRTTLAAEKEIFMSCSDEIKSVPSEARLRANRLNAQNSKGPTSPEGKKRSCLNATRH